MLIGSFTVKDYDQCLNLPQGIQLRSTNSYYERIPSFMTLLHRIITCIKRIFSKGVPFKECYPDHKTLYHALRVHVLNKSTEKMTLDEIGQCLKIHTCFERARDLSVISPNDPMSSVQDQLLEQLRRNLEKAEQDSTSPPAKEYCDTTLHIFNQLNTNDHLHSKLQAEAFKEVKSQIYRVHARYVNSLTPESRSSYLKSLQNSSNLNLFEVLRYVSLDKITDSELEILNEWAAERCIFSSPESREQINKALAKIVDSSTQSVRAHLKGLTKTYPRVVGSYSIFDVFKNVSPDKINSDLSQQPDVTPSSDISRAIYEAKNHIYRAIAKIVVDPKARNNDEDYNLAMAFRYILEEDSNSNLNDLKKCEVFFAGKLDLAAKQAIDNAKEHIYKELSSKYDLSTRTEDFQQKYSLSDEDFYKVICAHLHQAEQDSFDRVKCLQICKYIKWIQENLYKFDKDQRLCDAFKNFFFLTINNHNRDDFYMHFDEINEHLDILKSTVSSNFHSQLFEKTGIVKYFTSILYGHYKESLDKYFEEILAEPTLDAKKKKFHTILQINTKIDIYSRLKIPSSELLSRFINQLPQPLSLSDLKTEYSLDDTALFEVFQRISPDKLKPAVSDLVHINGFIKNCYEESTRAKLNDAKNQIYDLLSQTEDARKLSMRELQKKYSLNDEDFSNFVCWALHKSSALASLNAAQGDLPRDKEQTLTFFIYQHRRIQGF